jgi:shikimate kinase
MHQDFIKNIFLTGFMGVGKSTVGKQLAEQLGIHFQDLDEMIVERENCSIKEIFSRKGEKYFRDCETNLLKELKLQPATVYATGGGIVLREENRHLMSKLGYTVSLICPWHVLKERLQVSDDRPLVNSAKEWDDVEEIWVQRQSYYEDANYIVNTEGMTPSQVVQNIITELLP